MGFGKHQPGGWAFDIMPYMEESNLIDHGARMPVGPERDKKRMIAHRTPVPSFGCPSKREMRPYPLVGLPNPAYNLTCHRVNDGCHLIRADYAANSGTVLQSNPRGPARGSTTPPEQAGNKSWNGVTYQVSELRIARIVDGTSKTIFVGERNIESDQYLTGNAGGFKDNQHFWIGHDRDTNAYLQVLNGNGSVNQGDAGMPERDRAGLSYLWKFGGPHQEGWMAVFADGHVESIPYSTAPEILWEYGSRNNAGSYPGETR